MAKAPPPVESAPIIDNHGPMIEKVGPTQPADIADIPLKEQVDGTPTAKRSGGMFALMRVTVKNVETNETRQIHAPLYTGDQDLNSAIRPFEKITKKEELRYHTQQERDRVLEAHGWNKRFGLTMQDSPHAVRPPA